MKKLFILALLVLVSVSIFAVTQHLTILHVNDTHGHAWQFASGDQEIGGFAAVSTIVDAVREEVAACGGDVLVLHAGDYNTGVPESDQLDAVPDIVAMNMIGFDAVTLGNHEFDFERSILDAQIELLNCTVVSANTVDEEGNCIVTPYVIYEFADGLKVAVLGLTTEETAILEPIYLDGAHFENAVETTNKYLPELKEEADVVVALTHLGYLVGRDDPKTTSDELAEDVDGLDVIVDGHSHTVFEEAPVINDTVIVQAGEWNKYVGRLDLTIVDGAVVDHEWQLIKVADVEQDPKVLAGMDYFYALGGEKLNTVVGKTDIHLDGERADVRSKATNLANMIADSMTWKTGADIAVVNGGGIRASINTGDITYREVLTVLPFGNTVYVLQLNGEEIMELIDFMVSIEPGKGGYPQIAGLTFTYENSEVKDVKVNGTPIVMDKVYRVATNNYMALGGDGYVVFTKGDKGYDTGFMLDKVLADYVASLGTIKDYSAEQRYNRK
ncbi:MAG TPA: 5'-nucleotidase C-terminal domain-containing protein [Thermotogota bacterium]|nr:5'-nucleotidase C-terminal domain-containing protein [Thermotogota bacterium]HPJ87689.1 5'-nucleotidase C-terminal domain-containing protein [Thermotogota bacterium]HPR94872.1 5'-nucleotidase C-terminal domain-containing protein [Thermotogota bacterium]